MDEINMHRKYFLQKKKALMCLLICITMTAFLNCLSASFLILDDDLNIYNNPFFKKITYSTFANIWKTSYENLYIPVTYCIWGLLATLSKALTGRLEPALFHFANIIIHSLNSVTIFKILLKLNTQKDQTDTDISYAAFLCAFFFAIHPIQVESVAWISGMKDILFTFFSLISIYLFISSETDHPQKNLNATKIAAFAFFAAALLSKPTAIIVPFIISLIMIIILNKPLRRITQLVPWFLCSAAFIVTSKSLMPPPPPQNIVNLWQRPFLTLDVTLFYLKKIIWPYTLINDYGKTPQIIIDNISVYIQPILVFGFLYTVKKTNFFKLLSGMLLTFFICIIPYSGLIPFEFQRISAVADRYAYFGVFVISIYIFVLITQISIRTNYIHLTFLIIVTLLYTKTFNQAKLWQNDITLAEHTLQFNPSSSLSYVNMGIKKASKGLFEESIDSYNKALKIDPNNDLAYYNLGIALAVTGKTEDALRQVAALKRVRPYRGEELLKAIEIINKKLGSHVKVAK